MHDFGNIIILCNIQSIVNQHKHNIIIIVNQHKHNIIINVENNIRKTHQKEITSMVIVK